MMRDRAKHGKPLPIARACSKERYDLLEENQAARTLLKCSLIAGCYDNMLWSFHSLQTKPNTTLCLVQKLRPFKEDKQKQEQQQRRDTKVFPIAKVRMIYSNGRFLQWLEAAEA